MLSAIEASVLTKKEILRINCSQQHTRHKHMLLWRLLKNQGAPCLHKELGAMKNRARSVLPSSWTIEPIANAKPKFLMQA